MATGDSRGPRPTVRFEADELAALTRAAGEGGEVDAPALAQGSEPAAAPVVTRTATVHDPLTMALLAEVARTSRTVELEPAQLAEAHAGAAAPGDAAAPPAPPHPHLRRR